MRDEKSAWKEELTHSHKEGFKSSLAESMLQGKEQTMIKNSSSLLGNDVKSLRLAQDPTNHGTDSLRG